MTRRSFRFASVVLAVAFATVGTINTVDAQPAIPRRTAAPPSAVPPPPPPPPDSKDKQEEDASTSALTEDRVKELIQGALNVHLRTNAHITMDDVRTAVPKPPRPVSNAPWNFGLLTLALLAIGLGVLAVFRSGPPPPEKRCIRCGKLINKENPREGDRCKSCPPSTTGDKTKLPGAASAVFGFICVGLLLALMGLVAPAPVAAANFPCINSASGFPTAVAGSPNTITCSGVSGSTFEVVEMENGREKAVIHTATTSSFTFTPPDPANAILKVDGRKVSSFMVLEAADFGVSAGVLGMARAMAPTTLSDVLARRKAADALNAVQGLRADQQSTAGLLRQTAQALLALDGRVTSLDTRVVALEGRPTIAGEFRKELEKATVDPSTADAILKRLLDTATGKQLVADIKAANMTAAAARADLVALDPVVEALGTAVTSSIRNGGEIKRETALTLRDALAARKAARATPIPAATGSTAGTARLAGGRVN